MCLVGVFVVVVAVRSFIFPLPLSSPLTPVSDVSRNMHGWGADALWRRYHKDRSRAQGEVARSL